MSIQIEKILNYLDEQPVVREKGGTKRVMELLYEAYFDYDDIESEETRKLMHQYDVLMEDFPQEKEEQLFNLILQLCERHEMMAFSHGIAVGMHLLAEVRMLL